MLIKFSQMYLPVDKNNHPHRRQEMIIISSNFSAEKACRSRKHTISQAMLSRKDITNGMWSYQRCHIGAKKSTIKSRRTSEGARTSYLLNANLNWRYEYITALLMFHYTNRIIIALEVKGTLERGMNWLEGLDSCRRSREDEDQKSCFINNDKRR